MCGLVSVCVFFFKQKTAYEMRISDWSSDVCSSDLNLRWAWWCDHCGGAGSDHQMPDQCAHCGERSISIEQFLEPAGFRVDWSAQPHADTDQIGRASCRERVCQYV